MGEIKKEFDAVEMMRKTRDKISAEIEGMTLKEELGWLATQDLEDPVPETPSEKGRPAHMTFLGEFNLGAAHSASSSNNRRLARCIEVH
jgi:hypothetical protein